MCVYVGGVVGGVVGVVECVRFYLTLTLDMSLGKYGMHADSM